MTREKVGHVPCFITNDSFIFIIFVLLSQLVAENGVGHQMTSSMVKAASDWFDLFLK